MYVVSQRKLGVPQDSRHAFTPLQTAGILPSDLATRIQRIVGFRNVAVHEYTRLNLDVVHAIITKQLNDFRTFSSTTVNGFTQLTQFAITTLATLTSTFSSKTS